MDKEKVLDYVMNSPGNSNRAVLSGMLDESDGGNSDFSTAEVTFINHTKNTTVEIPNIIQVPEEVAGVYPTNTLLMAIGTLNDTETTFVVPLYKGYCIFFNMTNFTTNGNITQISENIAIIAGDGTITLGSSDDGGFA